MDRLGNAGHPTRRFDLIRKLIKRGEVKIKGGGTSGKPTIAVFTKKVFDSAKTVKRNYGIAVDPGYETIGFAVVEAKDNSLDVLYKGELTTGIKNIRRKMDHRRAYRRRRRYLSRLRLRCRSDKNCKSVTKFKKPRNIRSKDKSNATLKYGIQIHLNLYDKLLALCPLPNNQVTKIMEANTFDVRAMTWGIVQGKEYQKSPRTEKEQKCFVCGTKDDLQKHHFIQRKKQGTNVKENLIYLCKSCHGDVHYGHIYLPIEGVNQWRALGTMNAIAGNLQHKYSNAINFIPAYDMATYRRKLGLLKDYDTDAIVNAMLFFKCENIVDTHVRTILKKVRRHNRSRTHSLKERQYKLNGKIMAKNRRKRTDQTDYPSLKEFRQQNPSLVGKLKVFPGVRAINPFRKNMPTINGDVWVTKGNRQRFVANGVTSKTNLYSPMLTKLIGKNYINPDKCIRINRHEGMVIMQNEKHVTSVIRILG